MQVKLKCPNCNGARFSVSIKAYQDWDGEDDEWGDIQAGEIEEGKAYTCTNCGKDSELTELKKIEDEKI
jgi:DNA-directed RNA polymerase subunit RPC12/RpoP